MNIDVRRFISTVFAVIAVFFCMNASGKDDDWWFDIEVILFDRNVSITELQEQFAQQDTLSSPDADWQLITDLLAPNINYVYQNLPGCNEPSVEESLLTITPPITLSQLYDKYVQELEQMALVDNFDDNVTQHVSDSNSLGNIPHSSNESKLVEVNPLADDNSPIATFNDTDTSDTGLENTEQLNLDRASNEGVPVLELGTEQSTELNTELSTEPPFPLWSPEEIAQTWLDSIRWSENLTPITASEPEQLYCRSDKQWLSLKDNKIVANYPDHNLPQLTKIPLFLSGLEWPASNSPFILPKENNQLIALSNNLRWSKTTNRLLHFSWRQPVKFGEQNAEKLRLSAGINYAQSFDKTGRARVPDMAKPKEIKPLDSTGEYTEHDDFFDRLSIALQNPESVSFKAMTSKESIATDIEGQTSNDPIWQLDGFIQIYLKYINRTPYLHISSELAYRQPKPINSISGKEQQYRLASVPFKQIRRVISKQVHYFDHPMFGMIVEINRYKKPVVEPEN